jgi:hypothetical protein
MAQLTALPGAFRAATKRAEHLPRKMAAAVQQPARRAVLNGAKTRRGTLSLSGVPATLNAIAESRYRGDTAELELSATPRGAWGIASGTKAHRIRPKKKGRVLRLADGRFATEVNHKGTRRRKLWQEATTAAEPVIAKASADAARNNNPFGK